MQGETLQAIIADFRDGYIIPGSFYVAITRIKEGKNLFLREFHRGYVKVSSDVNDKIADMRKNRQYVFAKTYNNERCFKLDENDVKIGYLNINCLKDANHYKYVNEDKNLSHLSLLCLSDTRLSERDSDHQLQEILSNWKILCRQDSSDSKIHMGLLVMTPRNSTRFPISFITVDDIKDHSGESTVQILHAVKDDEIITFIYCRKTPTNEEVCQIKEETSKSNYLLGDMNLNIEKSCDKMKLDAICGKSKLIHLRAITTVWRNQLDHILVDKTKKHEIYSDAFFNFASDHKCIVMRHSHYANDEIQVEMKENKEVQIKKEQDATEELSNERPSYYRLTGELWLDDDILDTYAHLLNMKFRDIYIFPTYFCQMFFMRKRTYEKVKEFDKSGGLFDRRVVMIPLLEHSHWFLCVLEYQKNLLYILDPYTKEKDVNEIREQHYKSLTKIEKDFLQHHMRNQNHRNLRQLQKKVLLPPSIPKQEDSFNCGVYLIQFER